jgi:8-oxo-dGTP pyrophosphatase MutT (NUDIX family)
MAGSRRPIATRTAWSGRYLSVDLERWDDHGEFEVVHKHHAVGVVPLTPDHDVLLVRQFRPPVRDVLLEIPAGLLDVDGEDALSCATRELFEETGFRHETIEFMGGCFLSPGFTDEYMHLFWARTSSTPDADPEEGIELVRMPFARAVAAAKDGKVRNVSTALALLMAAARVPPP